MFSVTALPIRCAAVTAATAAARPRAAAAVLSSASYSSTAATPARPSQLLSTKLRTSAPIAAARRSPASSPRSLAVRPFSSTPKSRAAATSSTTTSSTASSPNNTASPADTLTWNRFLALRKTRRRLSLVCSIAAAVASTAVGVNVVMSYDIDALGAQTFGLDPIIVMGLSTVACGCVGWLLGPAIGDGVFRIVYRRIGRQIVEKEKQFFQRIKKFRVDPTQSSLNNPVPDFYGEKIGSVTDYRHWLKDQRAFNLKTSGRPHGGAGAVALRKKARKLSTMTGGRL